MEFDVEKRTARLSAGELAAFASGPERADGGVGGGLWRARLGAEWHAVLRRQVAAGGTPAEFEVAVAGTLSHGGWRLEISGRVDQVLSPGGGRRLFREVKTVGDKLPLEEGELRRRYPEHFAQLAAYVEVARAGGEAGVAGELWFVEAGSGVCQPVALEEPDFGFLRGRLALAVEFLNARAEARERLRRLAFAPAFPVLRDGQAGTAERLAKACRKGGAVLFSAPTGFGKTGALLESALGLLREGRFSRAVYLTGKATGQAGVVETLRRMTGADGGALAWQVRPKREHCINGVFSCRRETCPFLDDLRERWRAGGLGRFCFGETETPDVGALREAGAAAGVCPYEITREALAFRDVWIGDFNYVFSPASSRLFWERPGFSPRETLLLVDEAHNLPSRVADAFSHGLSSEQAREVAAALGFSEESRRLGRAWEALARLLDGLRKSDALGLADEDDIADAAREAAEAAAFSPPDRDGLPPEIRERIWEAQTFSEWLADGRFPKLLWCPRDGVLRGDCTDAAALCGEKLREFGAVVLSTATPGPEDALAEALGLETAPATVRARTPWRAGAYDVAYDARVDTRHAARGRFLDTTAGAVAALREASDGPVAVFFPSYAYAEAVARRVEASHPELRVMMQPRGADLEGQLAWVEEALRFSDALFLVLGSRFSEGIDALGGRVTHAMVAGPALPEVNAIQRARMSALDGLGKEAAFARVYQIPGLQKVNQALGRLVRAPGQRAKVLLHCKRFLEPGYARLLDEDFQFGVTLETEADLRKWASAREPEAGREADEGEPGE